MSASAVNILPSLAIALGSMYLGTAAVQWYYRPDMASLEFYFYSYAI